MWEAGWNAMPEFDWLRNKLLLVGFVSIQRVNDQKSISHLKIVNISGQKSVAAHAALASTQLLYQAAFYPKTKCVCLTKAKIVSVVADPTFVIFLQKVNYFK